MKPSAVIIGAGAAGLSAADALLTAGIEPLILEASDHIGGRVRALEGFADFPIELGAEEIHGPDNAVAQLAAARGYSLLHHNTTDDMMRLDGELRFLDQAEQDEDVGRAFALINSLGNYRSENWTVEEYLIRSHFPHRSSHYLDSRLGVEHGTTLDRLAMRGFLHYERGWEARETNYTLKETYLSLFEPIIERLKGRIVLNCPVESVDWSDKPVVVTKDGRRQEASAVLVTASIAVLRDGMIQFLPELPNDKVASFTAIGMDPGMKIIMRFRHRFWDERMYFLHTDGFLPQYWSAGKGKSEDPAVLTAFLGGSRAERIAKMGVDPVRFALGELDEIFGARIASRSFERGLLADWTADPYVRGLYSYPTTTTTETDREALARPLGGRLFFAGEASDTTGHSGTVHGAIDTGRRAAREICAALGS